jgi:MFS family permease
VTGTGVRLAARGAVGVIRAALIVRVLDEWWSYLPAGTIEDQRLDLGVSYGQAGWLLALLTLGGLIGSPVAALADRGYRRTLAVAGASTLALGLLAFATASPYWVLAVAATAMGGASDLMIRPLESSLADLADDDLDRQLGVQHMITWLGDFIGPGLLAIGAATVIGWRGVFAITAGVFVIFALVLLQVHLPTPGGNETRDAGDAGAPSSDEGLLRSAVRLARHPDVLLLTVAEFILLPLDEAFLGFAVARLAADGTGAAAQILAGGIVVGGIAGSAVVARRGMSRTILGIGAAAMIAGAFGAAAAVTVAPQVAAMALLGGGTAVVWAKVHHRTLTVVPGRSATVPTVVSMLSTPSLLVPAAMGGLADSVSITAALVAAATLTVPLAIVVLRLGGGRVSADELDSLDD